MTKALAECRISSMNQLNIRKIWKEFMEEKGHVEVANVSLVPQNDPSLLFVNSGMFPLVPYLTGQVEPPSHKLFNIQRVARFNGRDDDITEVGDSRHASFFHMIGNWSIGEYFKETQIPQISEFLIEKLGIDINNFYVTVFEGDDNAPRDDESINLWKDVFKKYGINAELSDTRIEYTKDGEKVISTDKNWEAGKDKNERIFMYPFKKNWWMRGDAVGELGGPDSEMFYDTGLTHDLKYGEYCHVNCDCGRFIEIGNNVFMQYVKNASGGWDKLKQKNVDYGGGLERISMAVANTSDMFLTPDFYPIIEKLEQISDKKYNSLDKKIFQVIADHMRAAVFAIADGVIPSNKDQGYPVRRLIRRAVRFSKFLEIEKDFAKEITETVIEMFTQYYPHLTEKKVSIIEEIEKEEKKFLSTLEKGISQLHKIVMENIKEQEHLDNRNILSAKDVFDLYQTYGFPIETTVEELKKYEDIDSKNKIDQSKLLSEVRELLKRHKEMSKAGSEQKFKGGLADTSDKTTVLHSTAHLFLEAARRVLGDHVHQRGSNITAERIRFDFSHPAKLTDEEIKNIEQIVNDNIDLNLERELKEYNTDEAFTLGAEGEFREKYGDKVNVYKFWKPLKEVIAIDQQYSLGIQKAIERDRDIESNFRDQYVYSFEICGGPHVNNTNEIKKYGRFKITKEESSSAGVRRIKAELV